MQRLNRLMGKSSGGARIANGRIEVDGRTYLPCSHCGKALAAGKGYDSPKPDASETAAVRGTLIERRVLCGPAYKAEYAEEYPDADVPNVEDGLLIT